MKKFLSVLLTLAMILCLCACADKNTSNEPEAMSFESQSTETASATEETAEPEPEAEEAKETVSPADIEIAHDNILEVESKEELAAMLGLDDVDQINQRQVYIKNLNYILPSLNDEIPEAFERGETEDGWTILSKAELKTMITPHIITTENWKDFIEPCMETREYQDWDEDDNIVITFEDEPVITFKPEYHYSWDGLNMIITNVVEGKSFSFDGYWGESVECRDGVYYVADFNDDGDYYEMEFDPDNYVCTLADAIVYEYDIDESLIYVSESDYETWETTVYPLTEYTEEYTEDDLQMYIQYGDTIDNYCCCGFSGIGNFVYVGD